MSKKEIITFLSVLLFIMTQNSYAQNDVSETSSNPDSLAQVHEGWDRFSISAGGFFPHIIAASVFAVNNLV